ncbi:hypothetical protein JW978_03640 [Candidatus Dojkabacteria bacterium]|nr:hypothetical protein [Candidatus Dojkabacteria bacterium]
MPSQDKDYSQIGKVQTDNSQYSLHEDMTFQSAKGHKQLFDSMDNKYSGSKSLFGFLAVAVVVGASIGLGWSLNNVGESKTDVSVSSEECGNYQVKVYTADGFYCQDCKNGGFGKLDLCEKESDSGECEVQDDGCFVPAN